jgi:acetylornithine deacetylase
VTSDELFAETLCLVEQYRHELVDFARQLVATPSQNPPGDERGMAELIRTRLSELGCGSSRILAKREHRPNLVNTVRCAGPGQLVMYCGHLDTKPIGIRHEWATDPFDPVLRDGKLFGLGASDMKGALAAMTYASKVVRDLSRELTGGLMLVFTADEEAGGTLGARFLSRECGLQADVALVGEPSGFFTNWEYLDPVSRGESCFRLRVHGTQMHSSISDIVPAVNANLRMAEVLLRLNRDLEIDYEPHPFCPHGITVTPAVMTKGGVYYGILPGEAECSVEVRVIPGMTLDRLRSDVEAFVARLRTEDPSLEIELEFESPPLEWIAPVEFPAQHPFLEVLETAAEHVLGFRPTRGAFPAWTDARFFTEIAGIPTIPAFGPGLLTVIHRPNEYVAIEAIIEAAKIYALAAVMYLRV